MRVGAASIHISIYSFIQNQRESSNPKNFVVRPMSAQSEDVDFWILILIVIPIFRIVADFNTFIIGSEDFDPGFGPLRQHRPSNLPLVPQRNTHDGRARTAQPATESSGPFTGSYHLRKAWHEPFAIRLMQAIIEQTPQRFVGFSGERSRN